MIRCLEPVILKLAGARRSDAEIQLAVRLEKRLLGQMQLNIRAHVCGNQLQLFGSAASWYQKQQVQEIAREFAPEYQIRNDLRVIADY